MKKILYFVLLLVITNNFLIFVFGLVFSVKAASYENTRRENYILDSALTLALQAREDNSYMPVLEKEFTLQGKNAGYSVKMLETGGDYIKVYIKKDSEILFREYMRQKPGKTAVPARPAAAAVPAATPAPEAPKATPTITPVAAPEFILIK